MRVLKRYIATAVVKSNICNLILCRYYGVIDKTPMVVLIIYRRGEDAPAAFAENTEVKIGFVCTRRG